MNEPNPEVSSTASYDLVDLFVRTIISCERTAGRFYPWDDLVHGGQTTIKMSGNDDLPVLIFATIEWDKSNLRLTQRYKETGEVVSEMDIFIPKKWLEEMKSLLWPGSSVVDFLGARITGANFGPDLSLYETVRGRGDSNAAFIDFRFTKHSSLRVKPEIEFHNLDNNSVERVTRTIWYSNNDDMIGYKYGENYIEFKPGDEYSLILAILNPLSLYEHGIGEKYGSTYKGYPKEKCITHSLRRIEGGNFHIKLRLTIEQQLATGIQKAIHTFKFRLSYRDQLKFEEIKEERIIENEKFA
jgi:hypothetical protein